MPWGTTEERELRDAHCLSVNTLTLEGCLPLAVIAHSAFAYLSNSSQLWLRHHSTEVTFRGVHQGPHNLPNPYFSVGSDSPAEWRILSSRHSPDFLDSSPSKLLQAWTFSFLSIPSLSLGDLIQSHGFKYYLYAGDSQMYISAQPPSELQTPLPNFLLHGSVQKHLKLSKIPSTALNSPIPNLLPIAANKPLFALDVLLNIRLRNCLKPLPVSL